MARQTSITARLVGLVFALPLALSATGGCGFDSRHDYSVTSTWLLNGATPDATRCKELGIASFRLTMDGLGAPTVLEADCKQTIQIGNARYGGFETTFAFDYGVLYDYTVDALNAQGKAVYGYEASVASYAGDFIPVDLDTVDVFEPLGSTASFSAEWVFSAGALATDCTTHRVETVEIWITSVTDPTFFESAVLSSSPCKDGATFSKGKVLARGEYLFRYVALDMRGGIAEESPNIGSGVSGPIDLALPRYQFKGL